MFVISAFLYYYDCDTVRDCLGLTSPQKYPHSPTEPPSWSPATHPQSAAEPRVADSARSIARLDTRLGGRRHWHVPGLGHT